MDLLVHIARVDAERTMAATKLAQPLDLCRVLVADGVVTDRRIAFRSSLEHASDGSAFDIVHSLRTGEAVQVDAVFRDQKKTMDVFVDQARLAQAIDRSTVQGAAPDAGVSSATASPDEECVRSGPRADRAQRYPACIRSNDVGLKHHCVTEGEMIHCVGQTSVRIPRECRKRLGRPA